MLASRKGDAGSSTELPLWLLELVLYHAGLATTLRARQSSSLLHDAANLLIHHLHLVPTPLRRALRDAFPKVTHLTVGPANRAIAVPGPASSSSEASHSSSEAFPSCDDIIAVLQQLPDGVTHLDLQGVACDAPSICPSAYLASVCYQSAKLCAAIIANLRGLRCLLLPAEAVLGLRTAEHVVQQLTQLCELRAHVCGGIAAAPHPADAASISAPTDAAASAAAPASPGAAPLPASPPAPAPAPGRGSIASSYRLSLQPPATLASLHLTAQQAKAVLHLPSLAPATNLQDLALHSFNYHTFPTSQWAAIAALHSLRSLALTGQGASCAPPEGCLAPLSALTQLTSLDVPQLAVSSRPGAASSWSQLAAVPQLQRLVLQALQLHSTQLTPLKHLTSLQVQALQLRYPAARPRAPGPLCRLLPSMRRLGVGTSADLCTLAGSLEGHSELQQLEVAFSGARLPAGTLASVEELRVVKLHSRSCAWAAGLPQELAACRSLQRFELQASVTQQQLLPAAVQPEVVAGNVERVSAWFRAWLRALLAPEAACRGSLEVLRLVEGSGASAVGCQELLGLLEGVQKGGGRVRALQVPLRCRKGTWGPFQEELARLGWGVRGGGAGGEQGRAAGVGGSEAGVARVGVFEEGGMHKSEVHVVQLQRV
jgi:hypothetical protein